VSFHLWFDCAENGFFMNEKMIGLAEMNLQWIFCRNEIVPNAASKLLYISGVISAAEDYVDLPKETLVDIALNDLRRVFPDSARAKLVHSIVLKEKRATFLATNEIEPLRPSPETPIENLLLAGDWTNTGLPATIEGGIRSGYRAAEAVLKKVAPSPEAAIQISHQVEVIT
jgi:zeta-carotene desaturase